MFRKEQCSIKNGPTLNTYNGDSRGRLGVTPPKRMEKNLKRCTLLGTSVLV